MAPLNTKELREHGVHVILKQICADLEVRLACFLLVSYLYRAPIVRMLAMARVGGIVNCSIKSGMC
jgi:hypothetical protein